MKVIYSGSHPPAGVGLGDLDHKIGGDSQPLWLIMGEREEEMGKLARLPGPREKEQA